MSKFQIWNFGKVAKNQTRIFVEFRHEISQHEKNISLLDVLDYYTDLFLMNEYDKILVFRLKTIGGTVIENCKKKKKCLIAIFIKNVVFISTIFKEFFLR